MSDIINKFNIFRELSEEFKQNIEILYVFNNWIWNEVAELWITKGFNVLFITKDDKCFALGENSGGVLGLRHNNPVLVPTIVEELCDKQIVSFANGLQHCLALSICGKVYSFGYNFWGQIGVGNKDGKYYRPMILKSISEEVIVEVCCGAYHSLALTKFGEMYIWGDNEYGQIGSNSNANQLNPIKLKLFRDKKIIHIACGWCHSMALTQRRQLYSWGQNNFGQLGIGSKSHSNYPKLVSIDNLNDTIDKIVCGFAHSLILTTNGFLYSFGSNTSGELGIGSYKICNTVTKINFEVNFQDILIHPLFSFSFALSKEGCIYKWGKLKDLSVTLPVETPIKSFRDMFIEEQNITYKAIDLPELNFCPTTRLNKYKHQFEEKRFLSKGSYGRVYEVIDIKEQKTYALKKIPISNKKDQCIIRELSILAQLKCEHIVEYKRSWIEKNYYDRNDNENDENSVYYKSNIYLLHIKMELCSTTLNKLVEVLNIRDSNAKFGLFYYIKCEIFKEILEGVGYLHKQSIIHRDLKPENILISDGKNGIFVKIADFGFAVIHESSQQSHTEERGSLKYMAPEVIYGKRKYDMRADIYSLGVVIEDLYKSEFENFSSSRYDQLIGNKLGELYHFKNNMISDDKFDRPDSNIILNHNSLWSLNFHEFLQIANMDQILENNSMNISAILNTNDGIIIEIFRNILKSKLYDRLENYNIYKFESQNSVTSLPVKKIKQHKSKSTKKSVFTQVKNFIFSPKKSSVMPPKGKQLLAEAENIDSWMDKKYNILNSNDYGNNYVSAIKLLTRQCSIDNEITNYSNRINEMKNESTELFQTKSSKKRLDTNEKIITDKIQSIDQKMNEFQKLAECRKQKLIESKHLNGFLSESEELIVCFSEQQQIALSEDIGKNYEDLQQLQLNFLDFRRRVFANEERYKLCKELAQSLFKTEVTKKVASQFSQLEYNWNFLLDTIEARELQLRAAGDKHLFNKDVKQLLSRFNEVFAVINSMDILKDLKSVEDEINKIEMFEKDFVDFNAELQALIGRSDRLQTAYPGNIADQILEQKNKVFERWTELREKTSNRKEQLLKQKTTFDISYKVKQLQSQLEVIELWVSEKFKIIKSTDFGNDYNRSNKLLNEHILIELDIDINYNQIMQMINQTTEFFQTIRFVKRRPSNEVLIIDRMQNIAQEIKAMEMISKTRKRKLIDTKNVNEFIRDSEQLFIWISEQKELVTSLDTVKNYEHLLNIQTKFYDLKNQVFANEKSYNHCRELVKKINQIFINECIQKRLSQLERNWNLLLDLLKAREEYLKNAEEMHSFNRDVEKALSRIVEMNLIINSVRLGIDLNSGQRMNRKYEEFERDLLALENQLQVLFSASDRLQNENTGKNYDQIWKQYNIVKKMWIALNENFILKKVQLQSRKSRLSISQNVSKILSDANKVESWIDEQLKLLKSCDYEKDNKTSINLLIGQKPIVVEIDKYSDRINKMKNEFKELFQNNSSMKKIASSETFINNRIHDIEQQIKRLEMLLKQRKLKLKRLFLEECDQFSILISEQIQATLSLEIAKDYKHLVINQLKFFDFKTKVFANIKHYKQCKVLGHKLIKSEVNENIEKKLSEIKEIWDSLLDLMDQLESDINSKLKKRKNYEKSAFGYKRIKVKP